MPVGGGSVTQFWLLVVIARGWLTGVVTSAAWSSRRSAASFSRRRAARARARGVVMSCWIGRDWHVGVDAELGIHPGACVPGGLGVERADADVDADIISASVDGAKDRAVVSGDILQDLMVMTDRRVGGFLTGALFVFFLSRCGSLFGK